MSTIAMRSVSALTVLGLSLGTAAVGAPIAFATPSTVQIPSSTINFGEKGSLTIDMRAVASYDNDVVATGNENPNVPGANLRDIPFELQLIQPITDGKSWEKAVELQGTDLSTLKEYTGNDVQKTNWSGTTKSDSTLTFSELPLGVYKLIQVEDEKGTTTPIDGSRETLVYIPMTNPAGNNTWNYDVKVYPKNQYDPEGNPLDPDNPNNGEVVKTVLDESVNVGGKIAYTISAPIPDVTVNNVTWFQISDQLDTAILDPGHEDVAAPKVELGGRELTAGTDFLLQNENGKLVVTFTKDGLEALTDARREKQADRVELTIEAKVVRIGEKVEDAVAENTATVIHNDPSINSEYRPHGPVNPGTEDPAETTTKESEEVKSYWANIDLHKINEQGEFLSGAEFQLYRCEDEQNLIGGPLMVELDKNPDNDLTDLITVGAEGAPNQGKATIYGLHVTDYENGADVLEGEESAYCLVETKAPEGYSLAPQPKLVELTKDNTHDKRNITLISEVTNLKETAGSLPLTGGMGIGLIAALGALIIALGGYAAKRSGKSA